MKWEEQLGISPMSRSLASKVIKNSDDYYVYIIWKMYTPSPIPFYVGKGHWDRMIKHEMKSEFEINSYKTRIIQKHKRLNIDCGYSVIEFFEDEESAYQTEIELIELIGRYDLNNGPLTNRTDGGDGSRGHLAAKGGDNPTSRAVTADGQKFSCLKHAGEAFNVEAGAISSRIKNGWEGYYYEDEGQRPQTKNILGRYRKPLVVEGREFFSASDASRELGIDVRMISKRIGLGWDGYYYLDQGQLPRRTVWGSREDKVSVIVRGKEYSTIAEAVIDTGESTAMLSKRCLSSNYPEYSRCDGKVELKETPPRYAEGVIIESKYYESISIASQSCNLTEGGVSYRCRSSNYPDYKFADQSKQEKESFTPEFSSNPVYVEIDGVSYSSQSAASRDHGIEISTLKLRCRSISFPSWKCDGIDKIEPKDGRRGLIGVEIEGENYRSVSDASKKTGIARTTIKRRISSDKWPQYLEL